MRRFGTLLLGCALLAAPGQLEAAPQGAGAATAVEAVISGWAAAFAALDGDKSAAWYATDARLWGTVAPEQSVGRSVIRDYFHSGRQRVRSRTVQIGQHATRIYGDTAVSSGDYEFQQILLDGTPTVRRARFSMTFVRGGDGWLIVDHHSSERPVGP